MMIRATVVGLSVFIAALVADTTHAASVSPGKTAVYASTAAAVIGDPPVTIVTATIAKGKKKRVLEVDLLVVLTGGPEGAGILSLAPRVNGLAVMEPTNAGTTKTATDACLEGPLACTVSAQYWLDLDAAEAAHPGVFSKQPLVIDGQVGWGGVGGPPIPPVAGDVSLRARLQKK